MQANVRAPSEELKVLKRNIKGLIEGEFVRKATDAVGEDMCKSNHLRDMAFLVMMDMDPLLGQLLDQVEAKSEYYAGLALSYHRGYSAGLFAKKDELANAESSPAEIVPAE